jgi:hypothetical protein
VPRCPACSAELVPSERFPRGLATALLRVDCPISSCAAPLVAHVVEEPVHIELLSLRDAAQAAFALARGRSPNASLVVISSVAIAAVLSLLVLRLLLARSFLELAGMVTGATVLLVALVYGLRRRRAVRDGALLLEALAHVPGALEPVTRGYR